MAVTHRAPVPNRGSVVTFQAKDGKHRPGVVLRVRPANEGGSEALLLVAAGTSKQPLPHRPERFVEVKQGTRYAKALRLPKTTWFKQDMVQVVPRTAIVKVWAIAPPGLLLDLERLQPLE